MYEVHIINNFPLEILCSYGCDRLLYQNLQWRHMVIHREDNGVSSLENLEAWRWPPRRSVAVSTIESIWTDSVIFQRGSNEGILGMTDRIPRGVQGQNTCRGSRVLCSSEAEAKCYVTVHIYFNVLCIKKYSGFHRKRG